MREKNQSDDDVEPKQKKQKLQDGGYDCAIYLKVMYETQNFACANFIKTYWNDNPHNFDWKDLFLTMHLFLL